MAHEVRADDLFDDGIVGRMILSLCVSLVSLSDALGSCGIIQVGQVLIFRILVLRTGPIDGVVIVGRLKENVCGVVSVTMNVGIVGKAHSLSLEPFSNSFDVRGMP